MKMVSGTLILCILDLDFIKIMFSAGTIVPVEFVLYCTEKNTIFSVDFV